MIRIYVVTFALLCPHAILPLVRHLECSSCRGTFPAATTFTVNGEALCEPCADSKVVEIQNAKGPLQVFRGSDPTVCSRCSTDFGSQELPIVAGLYLCEACHRSVLDFRYPGWLKTAAAVLLALLVLSLIHGRSYFVAGHAYYKGKKLLESGHAQEAVPYLEAALKVGAKAEEIVGNTALAYLKSGQPDAAFLLVKDQSFKNEAYFTSLKSEFDRFDVAATKAAEARKLFEDSRYQEAAKRMHEAAAAFPDLPAFARQADRLDASVAFFDKDYAAMVRLSETQWERYADYDAAASLAGAYACVYASEGDETVRQKAMEMMAKAKVLASSKEAQGDLEEWEPRFKHRMETRQIITREQYNAQFRPQVAQQEETK